MTAEEYLRQIEERETEFLYKKRRFASLQKVAKGHRDALEKQYGVLKLEEKDVDNLGKVSLSNLFNKLAGRMDEVAAKEEREYFEAKVKYDELQNSVNSIETDIKNIQTDIAVLEKEIQTMRENGRQQYPQIEEKYNAVEKELRGLKAQLRELDEAIDSGHKVTDTAQQAIEKLEAARGWATYDTFTRGGIFSHMAKYGNLDDAQEIINRIGYLMDVFKSELSDVEVIFNYQVAGIDASTRFIDFFFDNIFTDLSVRSAIDGDITRMRDFQSNIYAVIKGLSASKWKVQSRIAELEI